MKKAIYSLSIIFLICACEKDDTETVDKSLLLGNWEKIEIDLDMICVKYLEFNVDSYRNKEICTGSSSVGGYVNYTLEGDNIIVSDNETYKIMYLSASLLKMENSYGQIDEYKKP